MKKTGHEQRVMSARGHGLARCPENLGVRSGNSTTSGRGYGMQFKKKKHWQSVNVFWLSPTYVPSPPSGAILGHRLQHLLAVGVNSLRQRLLTAAAFQPPSDPPSCTIGHQIAGS